MLINPYVFDAGGIAPDVSAAYWRISLTKTRDLGQYKALLAEVEFRATVGGANQTSGGTAFASSTFGGAFAPAAAFDGSAATAWSCAASVVLPQHIGYRFAAPVSVAEVLLQAGDTSARANRAPEDFTVDYSDDGVSWTTYATITGEAAWSVGETRTYTVP